MRGTHRRHHPRIRLHPVSALAVSAGGRRVEPADAAADRQGGALDSGAAACPTAASTSTSSGPSEVSASVKAYFALKLAGVPVGRSAHGAAARAHSGARRHPGGEQLRQGQPQPVRSVSARVLPQHSARSRAAAVQLALPDVVLDARDRGLAVDRARRESAASGAGGLQPGRALAARRQPGIPTRQPLFTWHNFFLARRPAAEVVGAAAARKRIRRRAMREGRSSGCWSATRTPTAWARSIRR